MKLMKDLKEFWKKSFNKIRFNTESLFQGMKVTEDNIFHQNGGSHETGTSIIQKKEDKSLFSALLRGEVTQEVEELRYRTYLVDKESREYEYFSPTLALKTKRRGSKKLPYEDSDGLQLITSQTNDIIYEPLANIIGNKEKYHLKEYRIKIKYDLTPRFRLETYLKRLDVKHLDETHAVLDLYFSKYPNTDEFGGKSFVKEIEKLKNGDIRSDLLTIKELSFVTHNAYILNDNTFFNFDKFSFICVSEFDGSYILRFKTSYTQEYIDLVKKYYSKTMDMKYKTKEKKIRDANFGDYLTPQSYQCDVCGKTFEVKHNENVDSAYLDLQLAEQSFGKKMCLDCLKKYMIENNLLNTQNENVKLAEETWIPDGEL